MGRPGITTRMAVGALIIKHKLTLTDEETIRTIQENPYLQFFLGYKEFSHSKPFDPSLFVTIRKRLGLEEFNKMNDAFMSEVNAIEKPSGRHDSLSDSAKTGSQLQSGKQLTQGTTSHEKSKNKGSLLIDATVVPVDIKYPTDIELLNTSREHSERLIDILWKENPVGIKPRTYRRHARRDYLSISKKRKKGPKEIRKGIRKQLNYLRRNLKTINSQLDAREDKSIPFNNRDLNLLWIIHEIHRQQREKYNAGTHTIKDRIISVSQPRVRPIVRGKSGTNVEFGPKISVSLFNGYASVDRISWDNYNESGDLIGQVKQYRERFGYWPAHVRADQIYGTRENRKFLELHEIDYSFKPLGRPKKNAKPPTRPERQKQRAAAGLRNPIEGKFGEGKRGYGLDLVLTKLPETTESWIAAVFFIMNLARWLREIFFALFWRRFLATFSQLWCYFKERWTPVLGTGCP